MKRERRWWEVRIAAVMVAAGFGLAPFATAQTPADLQFDAASVKPSNPNNTNGTVVNFTSGGRLHVVNATLYDLIETAYDVRRFQIDGGPKWADGAKYDIEATPETPPQGVLPAGWNNVRVEVQALLEDRFQLKVHRETKTAPIYSLVIAKGGVKANLVVSQNAPKGVNAGLGTMVGQRATMTQLVYKLSRLLERPVVDNTGLAGNYDFKLTWSPDSGTSAPDGQAVDTAAGGSIFSALQEQLGLRLEATKGPIETVVVDHVDRPSEN